MDPKNLPDPDNLPEGVSMLEIPSDPAMAAVFAATAAAIKSMSDAPDPAAFAEAMEAARIAAEGTDAMFARVAADLRARGDEKAADLALRACELLKTQLAKAVATARSAARRPDDGTA